MATKAHMSLQPICCDLLESNEIKCPPEIHLDTTAAHFRAAVTFPKKALINKLNEAATIGKQGDQNKEGYV